MSRMTSRTSPMAVTRRQVGALAAAAGTMGLAACTGGSSRGGGGSRRAGIRFLYATGDETWNEVVQGVVDAFNERSETAEIQLDPLPSGSDYATALRTMDATGNWPAIVDMRDTATYISAGKLSAIPESVTDLLDPDAIGAAEDGEIYTVPSSALNGEIGLNIVYDKDYFEEHGLAVPTTYDEFIALLDEIKGNGDAPLATAAGEVWPSDQLWKPLAAPMFATYSDAGGFWNALGDGEAAIEDLREPLERLKTITDGYVLDGWQSTEDAQTTTLLVNGQTIMATSSAGIGRLHDIAKVDPEFNAGLFIIPADDGSIPVLKDDVNGDSASGLAISKQAEDDGLPYEAAVEFLEFYYSVECADIIESFGWIAPNIKKADEITRNEEIPGAQDYFSLLENPELTWYGNDPRYENFSAFDSFFRQSRIEFQDGQATLEETLAKVEAEFESLVDES